MLQVVPLRRDPRLPPPGAGRSLRLLLAAALLAGCSPTGEDPETRVRAVVAELRAAALARDVAAMKRHVSEDYADAAGRDRRALAGLATFHLLRNQGLHLLTRTRSVTFPEPGVAHADVLVAMAGAAIPGPESLARLRADLYRFALVLRDEEGTWRITSARWRPARLADFGG